MRSYYVYILASARNGTLYVGMTGGLMRRVEIHRSGEVSGFTQRYGVKRLVHVEIFENGYDAITREKRLKKWKRAWRIRLIKQDNPEWRDLYPELIL